MGPTLNPLSLVSGDEEVDASDLLDILGRFAALGTCALPRH